MASTSLTPFPAGTILETLPWKHCGRTVLDDHPCLPGCGIDKTEWTLELDDARSGVPRVEPVWPE